MIYCIAIILCIFTFSLIVKVLDNLNQCKLHKEKQIVLKALLDFCNDTIKILENSSKKEGK